MSVVGGIVAVIGVALLVAAEFAPHATWLTWFLAALALVNAAVYLFCGFNARRAARVYQHPGG
jgi:hypothetical protein